MSTVDPDAVDNDIGAIWRDLYKLEKHFGEEANPLSMAKKVWSYIPVHMLMYCMHALYMFVYMTLHFLTVGFCI